MMSGRILLVVALVFVSASFGASLEEYRTQIDGIDRQIVELLNKRAVIVSRIGQIKKEAHLPVTAPARERQVLERVVESGKGGPLPAATLRRIYEVILREMRNWEASMNALK